MQNDYTPQLEQLRKLVKDMYTCTSVFNMDDLSLEALSALSNLVLSLGTVRNNITLLNFQLLADALKDATDDDE